MVTGRQDVVEAALDQIAKVEGPNGPIASLGQVVVKLPQVAAMPDATEADKAARRAAVMELRTLANRAKDARPGWGRVFVMLGQLDELAGEYNAAAENYRKAIDIGDRQEFVIRRVTEIYLQKLDPPREEEALKVLNLVAPDVRLPPNLEQFRVVKNLIAQEIPDTARPEIDRVAPANADSERVQLLRGSLLAAIGHNADAEAAFRKALAKNDQIPETWTALVVHLVRSDRPQAAEEVLKQAEEALSTRSPKDPAEKARLIDGLAQCYWLLGKMKEAEDKFRAAIAVAPEVLDPYKELVQFLQLTGRGAEADQLLKALASRRPELARWARRHRALTLVRGQEAYRDLPEALALVRQNLAT
jgi:tetratricopeptide (TPR) repeat protein